MPTTFTPVTEPDKFGIKCAVMIPSPQGQWVKLEDYQALRRKLDAIAQAVGVAL